MLFTTFTALLSLSAVAQAACSGKHGSTHRRHHAKSTSVATASAQAVVAAAQRGSATAGSTSVAWESKSSVASSPAASPSSTASSSSSNTNIGWGLKGLKKNGLAFGWLPDDGSGGGQSQTIHQINSAIGQETSAQGWYAQAQSGTLFDGSQLTSRMDQIASGGVFQPAVMPTGGWWGLTSEDNQQAVAICKVMKQFTDKGIEVWLRFAHEVNYYQADGTYQGDVHDFKEGWATVAAACKSIAPEVKMWFTPNIADLAEYQAFYPDDPSTVDLIGVDYYPKENYDFTGKFTGAMKAFHDAYTTSSGPHFAIGEIGNGGTWTYDQRVSWLEDITSPATMKAMPNFIACSWFEYDKGYDFRIAGVADGNTGAKNYFAK